MAEKVRVPLKELRTRARLSQQDLAVRAGLHQHTIARLERGLSPPSMKTARRLAEALGVSVDEVFPNEGATCEPAQMPTRKE